MNIKEFALREKRINLWVLLFICFLTSAAWLSFGGCQQETDRSSSGEKENSDKITDSFLPEYVGKYHRLTYDKFMAIRNNTDMISQVYIIYSTNSDYEHYGMPQEYRAMDLQISFNRNGTPLSSYEAYNGTYTSDNFTVTPPEKLKLEHTFLSAEVDSHLYNYLETHHGYFFDGAEFIPVGNPYNSPGIHIEGGNFAFTMSFRIPGTLDESWTISKTTGTDEPAPDSVMYGLIDIMETNFISQF